jgi:hypothetical protein
VPNRLLFDVRDWSVLVDIVAILDVDHIEDALKLEICQRLPGIGVGAFECSSKRDDVVIEYARSFGGEVLYGPFVTTLTKILRSRRLGRDSIAGSDPSYSGFHLS